VATRISGKLTKEPQGTNMAKNHYSTKPKRRNRSGKRKDTKRIAANMAKIRELEGSSGKKQ
jgi:hypothetical protein